MLWRYIKGAMFLKVHTDYERGSPTGYNVISCKVSNTSPLSVGDLCTKQFQRERERDLDLPLERERDLDLERLYLSESRGSFTRMYAFSPCMKI